MFQAIAAQVLNFYQFWGQPTFFGPIRPIFGLSGLPKLILGEFLGFINAQVQQIEFKTNMNSFFEQHCDKFTNDEENKLEYT